MSDSIRPLIPLQRRKTTAPVRDHAEISPTLNSQDQMATLAALVVPVLMLFHLVGPVPADLGIHAGSLSPCESTAHCSRSHWASASPQSDFATLAAAVAEMPRTVVVEATDSYLHAEASSALFGFVDDLELLAVGDGIEARSVSRLGDSDLGVNAARLAQLERLVQA